MARYPEVRPINLFGDYLAGRQAALGEKDAQQQSALRATQLDRAQRLNALASNPHATPEQYIRSGDAATGGALYANQQAQAMDKQQALGQLAGLAQKALTITDPAQRKGFLQQAGPAYSDAFTALGADHGKGLAELQTLPDAELQQRLEQVAQFAAPQKPIEVAPGASLVTPPATPGGAYTSAFTAPPAPMSPYQKAETDRANRALAETARHNRFEENKPPASSVPSGYEADPAKPGSLRPIKGGPHDPDATSAGMDSRSSVMFNRVAASAQAAVKAIQNISELPITTSSGIFGTAEPGHGLYASARNVLAQKVTGQEAQDFKTMIAGVSRNLSTIETAGLAPNGAITASMNNVLLGEGDTQMTKLRKMAEMRQIVEENLKPQLANPKLAPAQKDLVRSIIGDVQSAVPFTHHDITLLQRSKNSQATIMDFATQRGLPAGNAPGTSQVPTATGPNGQKLYLRNGQWVPQ
jgi:hypothetical protein